MSENVVFNLKKNAVAELFFKSLKAEWAYKYNKQSEAELSILQWVKTWYNTKKTHSSLGNKSIQEFETKKIQQYSRLTIYYFLLQVQFLQNTENQKATKDLNWTNTVFKVSMTQPKAMKK